MTDPRPRFSGGAEEIFEKLKPIVKERGKSWLRFDEGKKVADAKTDTSMIAKAIPIVAALHSLSSGLSFKRASMSTCVRLIFLEFRVAWKLEPSHEKDYISTMTNRLMNLCHVVHVGEYKQVKWASELLPWFAPAGGQPGEETAAATAATPAAAAAPSTPQGEEPAAEAAAAAPAAPLQGQWTYGFNVELLMAWRCPRGGKDSDVELAMPFVEADFEDKMDSDAVVACFSEGEDTAQIPELTVGRLRLLMQQRLQHPRQSKAGPLWESRTHDTHHRLTLQQRVDRVLLLSLIEQTRQLLQIRVDLFGELPDDPPQPARLPRHHDALTKAVEFLQPLAEAYSKGEVLQANLKEELKKKIADSDLKQKRPKHKTDKAEAAQDQEAKDETEEEGSQPELKRKEDATPKAAPAKKQKGEATLQEVSLPKFSVEEEVEAAFASGGIFGSDSE